MNGESYSNFVASICMLPRNPSGAKQLMMKIHTIGMHLPACLLPLPVLPPEQFSKDVFHLLMCVATRVLILESDVV